MTAKKIVLELTESCKILELSHLKEEIDYLKKIGIQTALDDFGTGYASVNILRDDAVCWIKLDHSFVSKIDNNDFDKAIVEYMIKLCRQLSVDVIVEGIENADIAQLISAFKPKPLQEFYYSKSLPLKELLNK